jgi:hypothetical protein
MKTYQQVFGNVNNMPEDYCISVDENIYPPSLRPSPLGKILSLIKTRALFFNYEHVKKWKAAGVEFVSDCEEESFALLRECFLAYQQEHQGSVNVPHDYSVPAIESRYPSYMWGYKLGNQFHNVRSHGTWVRGKFAQQLIALGVIPKPVRTRTVD